MDGTDQKHHCRGAGSQILDAIILSQEKTIIFKVPTKWPFENSYDLERPSLCYGKLWPNLKHLWALIIHKSWTAYGIPVCSIKEKWEARNTSAETWLWVKALAPGWTSKPLNRQLSLILISKRYPGGFDPTWHFLHKWKLFANKTFGTDSRPETWRFCWSNGRYLACYLKLRWDALAFLS